jgi:hypothetical protein
MGMVSWHLGAKPVGIKAYLNGLKALKAFRVAFFHYMPFKNRVDEKAKPIWVQRELLG